MMFSLFSSFIRKSIYKNVYVFRSYTSNQCGQFKVNIIPALNDNYMYLLIDKAEKSAIAIDPVEPKKIVDSLNKENVLLKAVLTTHHHFDHAGGNQLLSEMISNIPIYGGDDRIEAMTDKLSHDESLKIDNFFIKCLHTPCHTSGHVCYYIESDKPICFTGDTLFIAGCGRFFEGTAENMFNSLNILKKLPLNTKLFCGHEYTISNLKFALHVEPNNNVILEKIKQCEEDLKRNVPTVPTTLADELNYNPFLRADVESVQKFTKESSPIDVIKILRQFKDNFKA